MSALPDVVSIDERRYQRWLAEDERAELAVDEELARWRQDGEVAENLWRALEIGPGATVERLVDRLLFGDSYARESAAATLYERLRCRARSIVFERRKLEAALDEAAELSEPF